jgi:hypothetical protein
MRRRDLLVACGAGLASAAGCAGLGGDEGAPSVDTDRLATMVDPGDMPESPLPYAVPEGLVTAHEERAETLLDAVPEDPDVPNGAVAAELAEERDHVTDGETAYWDWPP